MNTLHISKKNNYNFTVSKKQVNKNKTLKTAILYDKIEASVFLLLTSHQKSSSFTFKSIDFNIHKNAYLYDKLSIKNNIQKLNDSEIILLVTVSKKENKEQNVICKAIFNYSLKT